MQTLLKITPVILIGPRDHVQTYAMLDEGSSISLVDSSIASRIGLVGPYSSLHLKGIQNLQLAENSSRKVSLIVQGESLKFRINNISTVKNLTLPSQTIEQALIAKCPHFRDLNLHPIHEAKPTILIGQDNWHLIITREFRGSQYQLPVASRTLLGWVIHGPTSRKTNIIPTSLCLNTLNNNNAQEEVIQMTRELNELIKEYFSIDSLGVLAIEKINKGEERARKILEMTTRRIGDSWETGLLWKHEEFVALDSKTVAQTRLNTLERRLDRDPQYAIEYCKEMKRIIDTYAEEVSCEPESKRIWYVPHFGIKSVNKPEKRLRIVFDAAAKSNGKSLNDQLLAGPDLIKSLLGVLMRFRRYPVAIKGDIKDMFLRVKVKKDDQHAQRFLWRDMNRKDPPKEYIMTSLIFGSKASPCSAIYVKNTNAMEYENTMPNAASAIVNSSYVDDFLHSMDSEAEAATIITQVSKINSKAGFEMHEWSCNRPSVLNAVKQQSIKNTIDLSLNNLENKSEKVLGLRWDTKSDSFTFNLGLDRIPVDLLKGNGIPTKRKFLKIIMSIFDPLGLLSPFTIKSKILMQDVWISGIGWDTPLAENENETWKSWLNDLMQIKACSIPRCYLYNKENLKRTELHIFCDASKRAYAAVGYWRFEMEDGTVHTSIIGSKSRVTPLKPLSIPRLELQAALLGSRLAKTIEKEINLNIDQRILWSDSRTVLLWLKSNPRFYQTYVSHRLGEICELTSPSDWKWVPSSENPADDATRCTNIPLHTNNRWFSGPPFLKKGEADWPDQTDVITEDTIDSTNCEKRANYVTTLTIANNTCIPDATHFSSYKRLLGSTAQVMLAIDKMKGQKKAKITLQHLQIAENMILKESQSQCFPEEIQALERGQPVSKTSRLAKLMPTKTNDGLLKIQSRVRDVPEILFDNNLIILDGKNPITRLILRDYHTKEKHGSHNTVINEVRQKYWVLSLRNSLRTIVTHCQFCKLKRGVPNTPVMGKLPLARLAYKKRPFSYCGLDYFGPLTTTTGRKTRLTKGKQKRWVALFTCLTTRAIHLELVDNLSSDSTKMALSRMSNRRGQPVEIYSDNGTNFRAADKELREALSLLDFNAQQDFATRRGIKWCFIPPGTPHMGGAWERLVRTVKTALKVIMTDQSPRDEVLRTLLVEVEHSVNSRPLIDVSLDPRDEEALTPNHFLIGASSGNLVYRRYERQAECPRKQWELSQYFADCFWKRWLREYLPTLHPRSKWTSDSETLQVGDVVLIIDQNSPRNCWPKGVIVKTFPGPDKRVRAVEVRTVTGKFIRSSIKLIKLTRSTEVQAS